MTHMDEGALRHLATKMNAKTLLDVGCSTGDMTRFAMSIGLQATGVDGDIKVRKGHEPYVIIHDFTLGPIAQPASYDLCWMVEFVEHVEEKYLDNYMKSVEKCSTVAMTHASPGFPGHHHVNCRDEKYWVDVFSRYGFTIDRETTTEFRLTSTMKRNFVRDTGKVFRRS